MQLVDIGTGELCRSRVTLCEKRIVKNADMFGGIRIGMDVALFAHAEARLQTAGTLVLRVTPGDESAKAYVFKGVVDHRQASLFGITLPPMTLAEGVGQLDVERWIRSVRLALDHL